MKSSDTRSHEHPTQEHEHHHHIGHTHGHGHDHAGHHHVHAPNNRTGLTIALAVTSGIMILEFAGGLITNSLALLSDAGHMLNDAASLLLSLVAMMLAAKAPSPGKSYGFHRTEILAALLNGITLFIIAGFIVKEAIERFSAPPEVASGSMMVIAAIGLGANLVSAWVLLRKSDVKGNINVRSAYLHVLGDALGSVGAILAGLLMLLFSWYIADPIISVVVAALILRGAWRVMKSAVHILMEGTPAAIDMHQVKSSLLELDGVTGIHDLHIWTITSGRDALSCHLVAEEGYDEQSILQSAVKLIEARYGIRHATIQIEGPAFEHPDLECH